MAEINEKQEQTQIKEVRGPIQIEFPESLISVFSEKLEKISKKVKIRTLGIRHYNKEELIRTGTNIVTKMVAFTLQPDIDAVKIPGHEFLGGVIDKDGIKTVFSSTGDDEFFKKISQDLSFRCEKCGKVIDRNKRLFFLRENDGKTISLGRNCSKDYFGWDVEAAILRAVPYLKQLGEEMDREYQGHSIRRHHHYEVVEAAIRFYHAHIPFISGAKAQDKPGSTPTSSNISTCVWGTDKFAQELRQEINKATTHLQDGFVGDEAQKIREYYMTKTVETNFDQNLKQQFENEGDSTGLLTYAVYNYYWKTQPKPQIEKDAKWEAQAFDGNEVNDAEVTITGMYNYESEWGNGTCVVFRNCKHEFAWFTSASLYKLVEKENGHIGAEDGRVLGYEPIFGIGDRVRIKKATVKKNDEYKGRKRTVIKLRKSQIEVLEKAETEEEK